MSLEKPPILEQESEEKFKSYIEIAREKESNSADLVIIEGDKQVSLQEFLPSGVKFSLKRLGMVFSYNLENKEVHFQTRNLNTLGGRLSLLHEMGHAIDFSKNPESEKATEGDIWKQISEIRTALSSSKEFFDLPDEKSRNAYMLEGLIREFQKLDIPEDRLVEFTKSLARDERTAWAEALKLYRKIKKDKDLDLLEGAKTKDIIEFMEQASLGQYYKFFKRLLPEQQFKLFLVKKLGK